MAKQRYNWWQKLTVSWANGLIRRGLRREQLGLDSCYLPDDSHADDVYEKFFERWQAAVAERKDAGKDIRSSRVLLIRVLTQLYGREYAVGAVFKLLWGALVICGAFYFVHSLLLNVGTTNSQYKASWTGWALGAGFFCAAVLWGAPPSTATAALRNRHRCAVQPPAATGRRCCCAQYSVSLASDIELRRSATVLHGECMWRERRQALSLCSSCGQLN
jgi:hypothetical protein